jgi:hypothetical protein
MGGFSRQGRPGMSRYRMPNMSMPTPQQMLQSPAAPAKPDEVTDLTLSCRGVNRNSVSPSANTDLAFLLQQDLTNNAAVFKAASLTGDLKVDDGNSNTFTFSLTVKVAHPFKL